MIRSLVEWPFLLLLLTIAALCALFALTAGHFTKKLPQRGEDLPSGVGELFGIVGAAFGIILAFIIFVQWNANDRMDSTINTETGAMAAILRYTDDFDPSGMVKHAVLTYRDVIVNEEIPALREGRIDDAWKAGGKSLTELVNTIEGVIPPGSSQTFYDLAAGHADTLTATHRERIELSQSDLSAPMWWFVILSTVLVMFFIALIRPADSVGAVLMLLSVAVFFGLTIALIVSLNYPLNGPVSVSLEPYFRGMLANAG